MRAGARKRERQREPGV
uniref:Uncharacterized protein n=1 Tax=Anguilla anguilla TaxID=7936 RepID=A0A0E9WH67_ANGAN